MMHSNKNKISKIKMSSGTVNKYNNNNNKSNKMIIINNNNSNKINKYKKNDHKYNNRNNKSLKIIIMMNSNQNKISKINNYKKNNLFILIHKIHHPKLIITAINRPSIA